jgi:hypothetical protein
MLDKLQALLEEPHALQEKMWPCFCFAIVLLWLLLLGRQPFPAAWFLTQYQFFHFLLKTPAIHAVSLS